MLDVEVQPIIPVTWEAEADDFEFKANLSKKQGAKQFSEIQSLNKIQNGAGDMAQ